MNDTSNERFLSTLEARLDEAASLCEREGLATSTTKARLATLDRLFRAVPSLDPRGITSWVDACTNSRTGQPLGPHGKNARVIAAKWFLTRTALEPGGAARAAGLHRYPVPPSPGQSIDPDDFEAIAQFSPTARHDLAFRLVFECGFRPHEVLSIRACDVVDGHGTSERPRDLAWVHLPAANPVTPSGRNKTGARVVPVRASARRLLDARDATRAVAGADGRIFPWGHRHLTVTFSRMKAAHATERGATSGDEAAATASSHRAPSFQGRLYDLRHSAITTLYLAAVPDQVIRKVVGWTPSSRMPDVYVHVTQAHIQRAFEHLDVPGALPVHHPMHAPAAVPGPGARQARPPGWY